VCIKIRLRLEYRSVNDLATQLAERKGASRLVPTSHGGGTKDVEG
jgi:hypothetical protein